MTELPNAINILMTTYKKVKEICEKTENLELKKFILEMNEQLLDMKEATLELREENINLKEEIKKLKGFSDTKLTLKNRAYYDKDNNGPYCPVCWENEKKRILLSETLGHQSCTKCGFFLH